MNIDAPDSEQLRSSSTGEVLALHVRVMHELRRRGLSRTGNNLVADLAEHLVERALNLKLETNSRTGFDATDAKGQRYEIKARRSTRTSRPTHLSALRGLHLRHFDRLVAVLFDEDFSVSRAVVLPFEAAQTLAVHRAHVNAHLISFKNLWACSDAEDVTGTMVKALDSIMSGGDAANAAG